MVVCRGSGEVRFTTLSSPVVSGDGVVAPWKPVMDSSLVGLRRLQVLGEVPPVGGYNHPHGDMWRDSCRWWVDVQLRAVGGDAAVLAGRW